MNTNFDDTGYILIVDDLDENLQVLGSTLLENGFDVITASSGIEALEILHEEEELPSLILLDVMMPDMNGWDTCRSIKKHPYLSQIPVIFLTAKSEIEDIVKGFEVGGVDYITKPFNSKDLIARIKTHLELLLTRKELEKKNKELQKAIDTINYDLKNAKQYVSSILPKPLKSKNININNIFIPAETLAGDTFGYHDIDDENLAFYVIDVSGHGISSALLSISQLNSLRSEALPNCDFRSPAQVLSSLNETYDMENNNYLYCTIFYGVYNKATNILKYASGGHPPALLINKNNKPKKISTPNPIIGAFKGHYFAEKSISMENYSTLYIYTDGAFEVEMIDGSYYSYGKLNRHLLKYKDDDNNEINNLYSYLLKRSNQKKLHDDFTIMKIAIKS